jgi:hypothetical protein
MLLTCFACCAVSIYSDVTTAASSNDWYTDVTLQQRLRKISYSRKQGKSELPQLSMFHCQKYHLQPGTRATGRRWPGPELCSSAAADPKMPSAGPDPDPAQACLAETTACWPTRRRGDFAASCGEQAVGSAEPTGRAGVRCPADA